jgi:hypothetical protein
MIQYIEELENGDCFEVANTKFIVSCDFKSNGSRLCVDLATGMPKWFKSNDTINKIQIFTMDKDNCIIAIKESKKNAANKA